MTIGGYRIELFRQAVRNGKNITFVGQLVNGPTTVEMRNFPRNHEGHGGFTIDGIAAQNVTDRALSMSHPNIVLLMIGTNDINGNQDVANAPKRLGSLIDKITTSEPAALVVVASIIPIRNDGTNQRVITYNTAIKTEVSTRAASGKHVLWVDNYAVISQNANFKTALMSDDLHPNDTGYAALGQSFYSAISAMLPAATP
jgi:lysophospholipase L1-like esterase